jgi:hypothetical protein
MKRVGVREFRDHATKYLAGDEPLTIERHGEPIGYYFPVGNGRRDPEQEAERRKRIDESNARFEALMRKILERTGMTEDEFARYFDLNEPLPDLPVDQNRSLDEAGHATGG